MDKTTIINAGKTAVKQEADALLALGDCINDNFFSAVKTIADCGGRLVVSGIGKSAIVAQKLVATLNSTGTPALFMHAADAIHGDLGMVQENDVVLIISKSGDSPEIKVLTPLVKNFGNKVIGMVDNLQGYLGRQADIVLHSKAGTEACPNNLAPTTSTTVQMVLGDALAISLMNAKGFGSADFARYHPGGSLGKKMFLRVSDLVDAEENPKVTPMATIREAIVEMTSKRLGAVAVIDENGQAIGIITDGDIRRMMERHDNLGSLTAKDVMGKDPKHIARHSLAMEGLELMRKHHINQLVVEENGRYFGILHLQDLVREGIL